ncbi:MAG TPA: aminotransferase class V-fold PLP-dependent enzyme, partial [Myxococcales bacterium]|nr:aminotransferase class V-fold PLP-dependent enzyme [Myxococcales bacterium]
MPRSVYLDHHATTPVDPRVREAMLPFLGEQFGNAASRSHAFGWAAEAAVEKAREQVATLIGAQPREIVFTSGATESNNLAIKGAVELYRGRGDHLVTLKTEHKSVLDVCKRLEHRREEHLRGLRLMRLMQLAGGERITEENAGALAEQHRLDEDPWVARWSEAVPEGARVTYLGVGPDGVIDVEKLEAALGERTVLVSVMLANNEIGVLQPVREIGERCRRRGVLFHCDAAQGAGKVPFSVEEASADLVSLSAHKLYGPKGVGALYVRRKPRVKVAPLIDGGGHERGMRSGTLNVPAIVGFGAACDLARAELAEESARTARLRDRLWAGLRDRVPEAYANGSMERRLPGNLNVSFAGV